MSSDHPKGKIDRKSFRKMLTEAFLHSKNPMEDVEKVINISFKLLNNFERNFLNQSFGINEVRNLFLSFSSFMHSLLWIF